MKLIITNARDILRSSTLNLLQIAEIAACTSHEAEYTIDLPIETHHAPFSVDKNNILYAGLQWIGTISERLNSSDQTIEKTVHLNHHYANEELYKFAQSFLNSTVMNLSAIHITPVIKSAAVENQISTNDKPSASPPPEAATCDVASATLFGDSTNLFFSPGSNSISSEKRKRRKGRMNRL